MLAVSLSTSLLIVPTFVLVVTVVIAELVDHKGFHQEENVLYIRCSVGFF